MSRFRRISRGRSAPRRKPPRAPQQRDLQPRNWFQRLNADSPEWKLGVHWSNHPGLRSGALKNHFPRAFSDSPATILLRMTSVHLDHITKRFGSTVALDD